MSISIGLKLDNFAFNKIGDSIMLTSIPENLYKSKGYKFVDLYNHWIFDYNPYVIRGIKPDLVVSLHSFTQRLLSKSKTPFNHFGNSHQLYSLALGGSIYIGGPRLYCYEDIEQKSKTLCIHTTPSTINAGRAEISDIVLDSIKKNYKGYTIIQVGSTSDKVVNFAKDYRGTSIWEMVKLIASCEIFIGVNSGPIHIADCYPRVRKKILLFSETASQLTKFRPRGEGFIGADWINWGWEYYNTHNVDIGITKSHLFI